MLISGKTFDYDNVYGPGASVGRMFDECVDSRLLPAVLAGFILLVIGSWRERFEPTPAPIPEEYVLRPLYSKGREIWISDDSTHLHSTPDRQRRECLWRFM